MALTEMKDFLRTFKIPLIFGGCAIVAIIATLIVVTGGFSSDYGLYISTAYGTVSVTNSDVVNTPTSGDMLKNGDVITIGENSSCTIAYKGRKNSDKNYLVAGENTQLVISNDFDGKSDGEIFLRSGSLIANYADEDKAVFQIRTADSMITTAKSVSKISYYTNEFMSYTDLYTFMGNSEIQLYDSVGNPVNNAELQIQKKWGRIVSEDGPAFEALNLDIDLNELTAFDLKTLLTIAAIVGEDFPYTAAEMKVVYDTKSDDDIGISIDQGITEPAETSITENIDTSDTIQTAEPVGTTAPPPTETTLPGHTTAAPPVVTTVPVVTTAPPVVTESTTTSTVSNVYHTVTIIIDSEETIQEVRHGEDAEQPEDPVIDGLTFIGWDGSFKNITEDTVIRALFNEFVSNDVTTELTSETNGKFHTVTVVIGNKSNTLLVEHGKSADLPTTLDIEGYIFKGWDKDYTNITEDITITAVLERAVHSVTFVIGSDKFTVEADHGGSVVPPYIPTTDSDGNRFVGWDKSLGNIISDITITAVFDTGNYHTVTFIIDGEFHSVKVKHGETAEPPYWPITNKNGFRFIGWDKSLDNITEDITITAYYE